MEKYYKLFESDKTDRGDKCVKGLNVNTHHKYVYCSEHNVFDLLTLSKDYRYISEIIPHTVVESYETMYKSISIEIVKFRDLHKLSTWRWMAKEGILNNLRDVDISMIQCLLRNVSTIKFKCIMDIIRKYHNTDTTYIKLMTDTYNSIKRSSDTLKVSDE